MQIDLINFYSEDGVCLNGFVAKSNSKRILIATHGMSSNCFKEREKIIAEKCIENNISFLGYNNRGSELVKYIKKKFLDKEIKLLGGTTYEDPEEGYYDIKVAIKKALELGYEEIYLQGHSLGSTKVVYTYNKLKEEKSELLKYIKGIVLLSLVDIPKALKVYLKDDYQNKLKFAENKEKENQIYDIMPNGSFIHPISVKTFLKYSKYSNNIDFAKYSQTNFDFNEINNINIPIFMRWGNVNEMIEQDAKDLVQLMNEKIRNTNKDIGYIDGADHGYSGKEKILAAEIVNFLNNI